jgi:diguanylate cyclase (GGDEF)-like protein
MKPVRSFRNRLFVVIAVVVLGIEAFTTFAALRALERDALANSTSDLTVGERVFSELLATREQQLATGVRVLADDFGFREAVATGDFDTIQSVLANHGNRIDADLVSFIRPTHDIEASTHRFSRDADSTRFPFGALLEESSVGGAVARTVLLPDGAFQLVVAPIRAPQLIGWVGVGFSVNDELAAELKELTGLDVSFVTTSPSGALALPASTLASDDRLALVDTVRGAAARELAGSPTTVDLAASAYLSSAVDLTGDGSIIALLQRSMAEALAAYRRLLDQFLLIFAATLVVAVVAARLVAGGVTRPVDALAAAARRIAAGSYDERVEVERKDEFGVLANAFNEMQRGISEREERILHQSRHDTLTDLPNRTALHERLKAALARTERHGRHGAVLMLDLRAFKAINDTFGHDTGDDALRSLATRLVAAAREADTVARYGGNCFIVLIEEATEAEAGVLAQRLLATVREPLVLERAQVRLDLSIGAVCFPSHGTDVGVLLRRAEIAMYAARESNEALAFYRVGQDETHLRKLELAKELQLALEQDALDVYYQPKLDLTTGRIGQAEALLRWRHPRLGFVSPAEFVPIAERSGLMRPLTVAVLRKVVKDLAAWTARGLDLVVSANVSTIDLVDPHFPERLTRLIAEHRVPASRLTLEVTESALMSDPAGAGAVLERLRAAGFKLSIDDFGTGYSSLAQLKHMPVSELKIDKSFVLGLPDNADDAVIVRSTIELGHSLGLSVVAEGVEHERCMEFLRAAGCDLAQGYGISRPLPREDLLAFLALRAGASPARSHTRLQGERLALQS